MPNGFVQVNPLGLQITCFRVDQAFVETGDDGEHELSGGLDVFVLAVWPAGELSVLAP